MKKLLLAGVLAVATCGLVAAPSFAGAFGLFTCGGCCCCGCNFCVRQYNAFSPVCCGSITCDGCLPIAGCGAGGQGLNYSGIPCGHFPDGGGIGGCAGPDCDDGTVIGALPGGGDAVAGTVSEG